MATNFLICLIKRLILLNFSNNKLRDLPANFYATPAMIALDIRKNEFDPIPEKLLDMDIDQLEI